jgi:hypothetical protein
MKLTIEFNQIEGDENIISATQRVIATLQDSINLIDYGYAEDTFGAFKGREILRDEKGRRLGVWRLES